MGKPALGRAALLLLANVWVLLCVLIAHVAALKLYEVADVELPASTQLALQIGIAWPIAALAGSILGLILALNPNRDGPMLSRVLCFAALAELALLALHLVILFMPALTIHDFGMGG